MKDFAYHLSVKDCRAIKSAEIDLSEITVLTGVNASGKSTIARMFRDLVEMSAEYERLLAAQVWEDRMDVWRYALTGGLSIRTDGAMALRKRRIVADIAKGVLTLSDAIEMLSRALRDSLQYELKESDEPRLVERLRRMLDLEGGVEDILLAFETDVNATLDKFNERRKRRSYVAYRDLIFDNALKEGSVSLEEGSRIVFSNDSAHDTLDEITFVKRAIYIESPLKSIPQTITSTELNMGDAFTRIKEDVGLGVLDRLGELRTVISGDVDYQREDDEIRAIFGRRGHWAYLRSDGNRFNLDNCATGIKAMSILSILYSKGWLDAETLLIIDEPEAHLHPQWIVEYARILLLLSRRLRVRIILASHSPDMVNALHTIGTALNMGNEICFYLAEQDKADCFKYNYRAMGNKVGDIFKAYNTSFSRIDEYAKGGQW